MRNQQQHIQQAIEVPGLGHIGADSGLIRINRCSDGCFEAGRNGVNAIVATGDNKVEFIAFEDKTLAFVKSNMGYPAYYPVLPVQLEKPVKAVLMDLDAVYPFITVANTEFVELPSNCPEDRVTSIVVDQITYVYRDQKQPEFDYSWGIVAEQVHLVPTPEKALDGYIYFRPRPDGLTEDDLLIVPGFAYDYQEMLVFGGSKRTAMTLKEPDYQKAAYYGNEFDKIVEKADRKLRKPSQKRVAKYRSWS